jgi:hypothetical protein
MQAGENTVNDLETQKIEAEIANLKAQASKAVADAAKAEAEGKAFHKTWRDWSLEAIKLFGALALGGGGVFAAITGYQLSEIKKERTDLEITKASEALKNLETKKVATDSAVKEAQEQLMAMKVEVERLQTTLLAVQSSKPGASDALAQAITRTTDLGTAISSTNARLQSTVQQPAGKSTQLVHQKSEFRVGVQTVGVPDATRTGLNENLKSAGYGLHDISSSYARAEKPGWFSPQSTVLYYSNSAAQAAAELARFLSAQTGTSFAVQRGSGLGVDPGERDITLFVHYLAK